MDPNFTAWLGQSSHATDGREREYVTYHVASDRRSHPVAAIRHALAGLLIALGTRLDVAPTVDAAQTPEPRRAG